ncbi:NUDIX hydrolase [Bacillus taeanensis]|uniref:DNA mismatch repair protein MutT n=1 Tax=Bacillus taeanensis TaxID=273032 RepID=A0A366XR43_9BACI|nr:NUDIX domain-containing protein [Bacillus taeanensis]RBW68176.1 DNA mismatch repair protein MutT [Bacillus taeanensis]
MGYIEELRSEVGSRPLILTAAAVFILDQKNRILLQHRGDTKDWGIPGGFMELGESIEEAARREAREETGFEVGELTYVDIYSGEDYYFVYPNGDQVYNVIVGFMTREVKGEMVIDEDEVLDLQYFSFDNLPEKMIPTSKKMLERFIEKMEFSDEN